MFISVQTKKSGRYSGGFRVVWEDREKLFRRGTNSPGTRRWEGTGAMRAWLLVVRESFGPASCSVLSDRFCETSADASADEPRDSESGKLVRLFVSGRGVTMACVLRFAEGVERCGNGNRNVADSTFLFLRNLLVYRIIHRASS